MQGVDDEQRGCQELAASQEMVNGTRCEQEYQDSGLMTPAGPGIADHVCGSLERSWRHREGSAAIFAVGAAPEALQASIAAWGEPWSSLARVVTALILTGLYRKSRRRPDKKQRSVWVTAFAITPTRPRPFGGRRLGCYQHCLVIELNSKILLRIREDIFQDLTNFFVRPASLELVPGVVELFEYRLQRAEHASRPTMVV